jgi:hypothetical protein
MGKRSTLLFLVLGLSGMQIVRGQVSQTSLGNHGSFYLSVGNANATFKKSTIHINQNGGTSYDMTNVAADQKVMGEPSIADYSYRLGYFFNTEQTLAIEIAYDAMKYHVVDGQAISISGQMDNAPVKTTMTFSESKGNYYYMGGSNLVLVNFLGRYGVYKNHMNTLRLDALGRLGVGPTMPKVNNSLNGKTATTPSFQVNGWNAGAEAAARITIMRYVFVEAAFKYSYASYANVDVYTGTASQNLITTAYILSAGIHFPVTRHNPLFEKPQKKKNYLTIKNMNLGNEDPAMNPDPTPTTE